MAKSRSGKKLAAKAEPQQTAQSEGVEPSEPASVAGGELEEPEQVSVVAAIGDSGRNSPSSGVVQEPESNEVVEPRDPPSPQAHEFVEVDDVENIRGQSEGVDGGDLRSSSIPLHATTEVATEAVIPFPDTTTDVAPTEIVILGDGDAPDSHQPELVRDASDSAIVAAERASEPEQSAPLNDTPCLPHLKTQYAFEVDVQQLHRGPSFEEDVEEVVSPVVVVLKPPPVDAETIPVSYTEAAVPVVDTVPDVSNESSNGNRQSYAAMEEALTSLRHYVDSRFDRIQVNLYDAKDSVESSVEESQRLVAESEKRLQNQFSDVVEELTLSHEAKRFATETAIHEKIGETHSVLSGALQEASTALETKWDQQLSRVELESKFLVDQLSHRVADLHELHSRFQASVAADINAVKESIERISTRLADALKLELLPPGAPLPTDGTRMRLVIMVDFSTSECGASPTEQHTMLLPINSTATVGMLKREVLRRSLQQGILPEPIRGVFVYSNTVAVLDGIVLFEDDTLEDVGVVASDKITIRCALKTAVTSVASPTMTLIAPGPSAVEVPTSSTSDRSLGNGAPPEIEVPLQASVAVFLNVQDSDRISEQESLERRLLHELARMDLTPLLHEASIKKVGIAKAVADKVRVTLLDRCTYSHDDYERRVARGALEKLNDALASQSTTADGIELATRAARAVLSATTSNSGETDRVAALATSAALERNRKERLLEDIKDLIFSLRHRIRVPPQLFSRTESLLFNADRAVLLAPSSTTRELDSVHKELSEFVDSIRTTQPAAV